MNLFETALINSPPGPEFVAELKRRGPDVGVRWAARVRDRYLLGVADIPLPNRHKL